MRTGSPRARADSLFVGAATSGPSLEEGAGRHERERRADETFGREAHDELVDEFRGERTALAPQGQ